MAGGEGGSFSAPGGREVLTPILPLLLVIENVEKVPFKIQGAEKSLPLGRHCSPRTGSIVNFL